MSLKIAVIGSGVSGLAAVWTLQRTAHEVHLFEAQERPGGHVQTVEWKQGGGGSTMVDIAFALFNRVTYPNFTSFLSHAKIPVIPVKPSFGLSREDGGLEWSSASLTTLFVQWRSLFSMELWAMLCDIVRFNMTARRILHPEYPDREETVEDFFRRNTYSRSFQTNYFVPLVSALWIHDPQEAVQSMPMKMVVRFLYNHQLLDWNPWRSSLQWLVVDGGANQYVQAILANTPPEHLHTSTPVAAIHGHGGEVSLHLSDGTVQNFDRVIVATHPVDSLRILGDYAPKPLREALKKFRVSHSSVVLHSDLRFMPRNRKAWSAWNYHGCVADGSVSLTADLALLSGRPERGPILATLNPYAIPDFSRTQGVYHHQHPIFDNAALEGQTIIGSMQGFGNIWLAGAWMGYGFHEDGFTSGVEAARMVCPEIELPFPLRDWEDDSEAHDWNWEHGSVAILSFLVNAMVAMIAWVRRLYPVFRAVKDIKKRT